MVKPFSNTRFARFLKFIAYSGFFILALMYFTPKVALYYFAETQLKPYGVIVTDEKVIDNGFTLSIKDAVVTFKNIESATIKDTDIYLFALFNKIKISDIKLASTAATLVPTGISFIDISYTIFNPLNIVAYSSGGFGEAEVNVSLLDKKAVLKLKPSKLMSQKYRSTLRNLKKSKDGGYEYAKNF
jgi:hypothetical protein